MGKINQIFSWAGLSAIAAIPLSVIMEWGDVSEAADMFTSATDTAADSAVDFAKNVDVVDDGMREIITIIDRNVPNGNVLEQGFEATFDQAVISGKYPANLNIEEVQSAIKDIPFELTDTQAAALSESQLSSFKELDKAEFIHDIITSEYNKTEGYNTVADATEDFHKSASHAIISGMGRSISGLGVGAAIGSILPETSVNNAEHQGTQAQAAGNSRAV